MYLLLDLTDEMVNNESGCLFYFGFIPEQFHAFSLRPTIAVNYQQYLTLKVYYYGKETYQHVICANMCHVRLCKILFMFCHHSKFTLSTLLFLISYSQGLFFVWIIPMDSPEAVFYDFKSFFFPYLFFIYLPSFNFSFVLIY